MDTKFSALDIAAWFLYKNSAEKSMYQTEEEKYEGLTNLKIQKLLYYAQGIYLAINDSPLFAEEIEAWENGPVVSSVYHKFSHKKANVINPKESNVSLKVIDIIESNSKAKQALELTYRNFAIYTAWQLRNLTHAVGSPWDQMYEQGKNVVIPQDLIKDYFQKEIVE